MMVVDADGNPTYVGYRFAENGKKIRIFEYTLLLRRFGAECFL